MFYVRIVFDWRGEEVYDLIGPYDRYLADLVCLSMADGHLFGITVVHVKRAMVVPA